MEEFETTKDFIKLLKNKQYPKVVMKNDENEDLDFKKAVDIHKKKISNSNNYDYLFRENDKVK